MEEEKLFNEMLGLLGNKGERENCLAAMKIKSNPKFNKDVKIDIKLSELEKDNLKEVVRMMRLPKERQAQREFTYKMNKFLGCYYCSHRVAYDGNYPCSVLKKEQKKELFKKKIYCKHIKIRKVLE